MDYNEDQQVAIDPIDTLYKVVSDKGLYSKSIDEFKKQYSTPDQIDKLYQVIKDEGLYSKTKEEFSTKYFPSTNVLPKLDYRAPVQQTASKESIPQPNLSKAVPTETTANQFAKKHIEAQNTLHQELTGNNELIPNLIKKQKASAQADQNLTNFAQQPRSDQPSTGTQQMAVGLLPKPPDPTADDQEVADFAQRIQADPTAGRAFLQHIIKSKPEKAQAIQSAAYVNDAMNRLSQDPDSNASDKEGKVVRNAQDIAKGKLNYSVQGGLLTKPEDPWQSISTGLQQKNKAFADYNIFSTASPAQAIQELEKRRGEHDPDEPIPVPEGFIGELTGGMAGQPLKGLVAGKIAGMTTALIPGAQETAPAVDKFITAAVSSNDFRKMSYAHSLQQNYNQLRNEGMDPEQAYEKANGQAKDEAMIDAISGAAMMYGAGAIGDLKLPSFNLSSGFKNAVVNGLKQGVKGVGEAGAIGLIQGAGQDIKNKLAEDKGIQRSGSGEDIKNAMESGALFTLGMAALAKGGSLISAKTRSQILQGLSKATPGQVDAEIGSQIIDKHITPDEAVQLKKDIEDHRILDAGIPDNVTEESRMKIQDKIKRRNYLETQLESSDAAFHPEIKEKIKAVNEDILELAKDKVPRGETQGIQSPKIEDNGKTNDQAETEKVSQEGAENQSSPVEGAAPSIKLVSDKIQSTADLRTWDLGDMEGKPEDAAAKKHIEGIVQAWDKHPAGETGGETFGQFVSRVIPAFKKILSGEEGNTAVITHSSVLKAFKVWDEMGRPEIEDLTPEQKTEFANKFNKEETYNGDIETFKGDKGDIHVIRHGQTEDNAKNNFRSGDTNLTKEGEQQAAESGRQLGRQTGGDIPKIITSDLPRAIHTSNIIHGELTGERPSQSENNVPRGTFHEGQSVQSAHFEGERKIVHVTEDGQHVIVEDPGGNHIKHEIPINEIKTTDNASSIRKNQSGTGKEGPIREGGENPRSQDLQLAQEQTPKHGETPQQAGEGITEESPMTGITHAQTNETAKQLGLETYEQKPETVKEWDAEADKRLREDPQTISKLLKKLEDGHEPDKIDQRIMARYLSSLKSRIEENSTNELLAEYKHAKDLSDVMGGREVAKSLVARRGSVPVKDSLADYMIEDMDSSGVEELTPVQKEQNKKEFDEISKTQSDLNDKIKALEKENAKLKANSELSKTKKETPKNTKKSHDDYVKERKSFVDQLKELKEKAEKDLRDKGIQKMGIGFTLTPEMLKVVGKMVKSLVEEGIDKLEDVVKNIHGQIKDVFPGIEEKGIHDMIAGEYGEKKQTKNEISEKLRDLRTQAKLINRLEDLQNGIEPKSEKKKIERNKEITELKKQIKEHDLTKSAQTKKNIKDQIDKLQDDLNKDKYESDAKEEPLKLDKEGQALRDKLNKLRQEREVRLLKQQYAQRSTVKKTMDIIAEVGNTPRALMSSLDFSAPLRQGLWGVTKQLTSHPGDLARQFSFMFKAAKSQKIFDRWFADLKEAPDYEIIQKSGLPLADPHDPKLAAKEEAFMSNYAEKIPIIGRAIKGSENAYVGFLNKMRVDMFRRATDGFAANGKTFTNSPELYKAMADYIGAATGRGKMPEILEKSAPILNAAFFSPRLIASRLNLLTNWANPNFYNKVPREIRIQYFKDMAKFIGTGALVLGLAKMGGADVETDPTSSDFGKIKIGNTRWDIWGGFQQYVRLAAQLITGQQKSATTGKITELNDPNNYRSKTRADVLMTFARGKLAPVPAETWDLLAGKDVTGKPATLSSEAAKNLPLVLQDIYDAYQDKGVQGALGVGVPSMFGVGVQTFDSSTMSGGSGGGSGAGGSYKIKQWQ